ncbi:hypothetical protein BKA67DRAFT_111195 [Truncatella angustata]|uniref:Uncharacterized protein n=1 Tax=Truncatella angustata TaxID=152316 RepID=A0A9P8RG48_9PEZI|nr:uncharacterized protein BKA67DRAFT_111195 [Truncatella angustata]KAH6645384.1 hypothetical protein BKA67DRAFT_111195 [Truncatella angustata]
MQEMINMGLPANAPRYNLTTFNNADDPPHNKDTNMSTASITQGANNQRAFFSMLNPDMHGVQLNNINNPRLNFSAASQSTGMSQGLMSGTAGAPLQQVPNVANNPRNATNITEPGVHAMVYQATIPAAIQRGMGHYNGINLNEVDFMSLWQPAQPQSQLILPDGTVFDPNNYIDTINVTVREAFRNPRNPIYAREGITGLSRQQIHERHRAQAKFWQVMCTDELFKKGMSGNFVITRKYLLTLSQCDTNTTYTLSQWDATWMPCPNEELRWGWVTSAGDIFDTSGMELIDMQAVFDHHLSSCNWDYETMMNAGTRVSAPGMVSSSTYCANEDDSKGNDDEDQDHSMNNDDDDHSMADHEDAVDSSLLKQSPSSEEWQDSDGSSYKDEPL